MIVVCVSAVILHEVDVLDEEENVEAIGLVDANLGC